MVLFFWNFSSTKTITMIKNNFGQRNLHFANSDWVKGNSSTNCFFCCFLSANRDWVNPKSERKIYTYRFVVRWLWNNWLKDMLKIQKWLTYWEKYFKILKQKTQLYVYTYHFLVGRLCSLLQIVVVVVVVV